MPDDEHGQLRLTPEDRGPGQPFVVDVVWPDRFVKLAHRLTPGGALEFAMRAPAALLEILQEIVALGQLDDIELDHRARRARQTAERLDREQRRRREARQKP